jgi:hypothetical protein
VHGWAGWTEKDNSLGKINTYRDYCLLQTEQTYKGEMDKTLS